MVCYVVPILAAAGLFGIRKKYNWHSQHVQQLNVLLLGGAVFGFVDHLWNGELFLIGEKPLLDIALGVVITASIVAVWGALILAEHAVPHVKKQRQP